MKSFLVMHACGHGRTAYVTAPMIRPGWQTTLERVQDTVLREARRDCPECRRRQTASYRFGLVHCSPDDLDLAGTRAAERWATMRAGEQWARQHGGDNGGGPPSSVVDRWLRQLDYECRPAWRRAPKVPWYRATLHAVEHLIAEDWEPGLLGESDRWWLLLDVYDPPAAPTKGGRPILSPNPDPTLFDEDRFRVIQWYPGNIVRGDLWCRLFFTLYRAPWGPGGTSPQEMAWRRIREKVEPRTSADTPATE